MRLHCVDINVSFSTALRQQVSGHEFAFLMFLGVFPSSSDSRTCARVSSDSYHICSVIETTVLPAYMLLALLVHFQWFLITEEVLLLWKEDIFWRKDGRGNLKCEAWSSRWGSPSIHAVRCLLCISVLTLITWKKYFIQNSEVFHQR